MGLAALHRGGSTRNDTSPKNPAAPSGQVPPDLVTMAPWVRILYMEGIPKTKTLTFQSHVPSMCRPNPSHPVQSCPVHAHVELNVTCHPVHVTFSSCPVHALSMPYPCPVYALFMPLVLPHPCDGRSTNEYMQQNSHNTHTRARVLSCLVLSCLVLS